MDVEQIVLQTKGKHGTSRTLLGLRDDGSYSGVVQYLEKHDFGGEKGQHEIGYNVTTLTFEPPESIDDLVSQARRLSQVALETFHKHRKGGR